LTMPTLLVLGAEERSIDSHEALTAAEGLPLVRSGVIPHCGHAPQIERAKTINRMVIEFMGAHPGAESSPAAHPNRPR
jgi:pimeloyl-ACP methyl ester carboxylesterase